MMAMISNMDGSLIPSNYPKDEQGNRDPTGGSGYFCGATHFPSPLVGEGGALWSALALLSAPDEGSLSAETDPSPVASLREAPPSPTRGEGKESERES